MQWYIFIGAAFVGGIVIGMLLQMGKIFRLRKECKSLQGLLESERLIKETGQKENNFLLQAADAKIHTLTDKLQKAEKLIRVMDSDILMLQKSNEETEALLAGGEPLLHEMKLKLIEANNTIARFKSPSPGK